MPQVLKNGVKRMAQRRKGAQPGNLNAMKHGRFSRQKRAEHLAERLAESAERTRRHQEWLKTIPRTDYGAICDAIRESARKARAK
jgi:hypothetical protein